jgi:hAT family C-terminal dimerisation region
MDYLPIQASSMPCERIFSSSSETATKHQNRMKPELMEALQMLKFMLKKKWLNFTEGLQTQLEELIDNQGDTRARNTLHSLLHAETRAPGRSDCRFWIQIAYLSIFNLQIII